MDPQLSPPGAHPSPRRKVADDGAGGMRGSSTLQAVDNHNDLKEHHFSAIKSEDQQDTLGTLRAFSPNFKYHRSDPGTHRQVRPLSTPSQGIPSSKCESGALGVSSQNQGLDDQEAKLTNPAEPDHSRHPRYSEDGGINVAIEQSKQQGKQKWEHQQLTEEAKEKCRSKMENIKPPPTAKNLRQPSPLPRDTRSEAFMKNLTKFMKVNNLPLDMNPIVEGRSLDFCHLFMIAGELGFSHSISRHNAWPHVAHCLGFNMMRSPTAASQIKNIYGRNLLAFEDAWSQQKVDIQTYPGWGEKYDIAQAEYPDFKKEETLKVSNSPPFLETKISQLQKHELASRKSTSSDDFSHEASTSIHIVYSKGSSSDTIRIGTILSYWSEEQLRIVFSKQPGYQQLWSMSKNLERTRQGGTDLWVEFENIECATSALHHLSGQPSSLSRKFGGSVGKGTSAVAMKVLGTVRESISKICESISRDLQLEWNSSNVGAIAENLGEVIKAFTIQLGFDQSHDMGPSIMYFLYKNYNTMCALLKEKLMDEDNLTKRQQGKSKAMSLAEKMAMWHREGSRKGSEVQEIFEGVDDLEDDEPKTNIELAIYRSVILRSSAYMWLVSTLKSQASLSYGEGSTTASDTIRRMVLEQLKSGTMSKNQPPRVFVASFLLPGYRDTLKTRSHLSHTNTNLADIAVLNASSKTEAQFSTAGEYIRQVWHDSGLLLLQGFQILMDGNVDGDCVSGKFNIPSKALHTNEFTVQGQDPVNIRIYTAQADIRVVCNGSAYLIAQCAAQLAWMSCALRSGGFHPLVRTPRLIHTGVAEFLVTRLEETSGDQKLLSYEDICGRVLHASPLKLAIVWGFPTARRPEGFPGVAMPGYVLTPLFLGFQGTNNRPKLLIRGAAACFVEEKNDNCLWHLEPSPGNACPCSVDQLGNSSKTSVLAGFKANEFHHNHHVISCCDHIRQPPQAWYIRPDEEQEVCSKKEGKKTMGQSPRPSSLPSDLLTKQSTESDSIDTDLLSVSSFSCDSEDGIPELHQYMLPVIDNVAHELFFIFQQRFVTTNAPCDGETTETPQDTTGRSCQIAPNGSSSSNTNPRKRKADDQDEEEADPSRQNRRPEKQSKIEENPSAHNFACPFWKFDSTKYRTCLHVKLLSSSRVKQHLSRSHTPQFYCQFCFVIFKEEKAQEEHIVQRSCKRSLGTKLDGISPEQGRQLSKKPKVKEKLTEEQKWYRIWDIILPGYPQPGSPYIDSQLADHFASFREHCQTLGPEILEGHIRSSESFAAFDEGTRVQSLRSILARGLDMVCESWMLAQQNTSLPLPATPAYTQDHSSVGPVSSTTPSHSSVGVPLNSQRNLNIHTTMRVIDPNDVAFPGPSTLRDRGLESTHALTEPMPSNAGLSTVQTFASSLDPSNSYPFNNTAIFRGNDSHTTEFGELFEWPDE